MLPFSVHCLMTLYICTKFQKQYLKGFQSYKLNMYQNLQRALFHENIDGVMILVLCTSPDTALYLSQIL